MASQEVWIADAWWPVVVEVRKKGVGRDGGSITERTNKVFVWNTRPKNHEYYTDKWSEFLAS
jgi:putative spermidine/putrescine transport system substrate-binding protein